MHLHNYIMHSYGYMYCSLQYELSGVTNNVAVICVYLQFMCHRKKPLEASDTIPEARNFQILML